MRILISLLTLALIFVGKNSYAECKENHACSPKKACICELINLVQKKLDCPSPLVQHCPSLIVNTFTPTPLAPNATLKFEFINTSGFTSTDFSKFRPIFPNLYLIILNFRTVENHSRLGLRITTNGITNVITIETLGESAEFTTIEELSASDSIELINASGEFVTLSALLGIIPF